MMSAIVILVLFLALLASAILATLFVVYYKLTRGSRSQEYSQYPTDVVSSLSMGSIEKYLGFHSTCQPTRHIPAVDAPTICVSTTTSFHSLESMEAINDGSYYPQRTHVCSSRMHESIIHRRIGSRGIRPRHPIQPFVNTVQVVPVGDATPFDPLECDSDLDTFRFPTEGPSESYLRAMGYQVKKTEVCESILPSFASMHRSIASTDIASVLTENDGEELDITDADPFHPLALPYYDSAMSLSVASYDIASMIEEIEDEITVYTEAKFNSHQAPSSKALASSTLMEEDESPEDEDIVPSRPRYRSSAVSKLSALPILAEDSQLAYLAPLFRASRSPALLTVAEEDDDASDDGSQSDDGTCDSDSSGMSAPSTAASSPDPSLYTSCDISNDIIPLDWPVIAISNTTSFHTLDSLEALCDYASDLDSTSHICSTNLCDGLHWRPMSELENDNDDDVDYTLLCLHWSPVGFFASSIGEYEYEAEDDEEDDAAFAFLADNDDDTQCYDDWSDAKAHYNNSRSWRSETGTFGAITEDDEDGDACLLSSDAGMLESIPEDDEDGDAYLSSSDDDASLSSSSESISTSATSCTSLELDSISKYSFGVPLARCPSRHSQYTQIRPLSLVTCLV